MKNWRLNLILIVIFIFGAAVTSRLFYLQILSHKFYQSQALGQQAGFQEIYGTRGQIFFANSQESKGSIGTGETKSMAINRDFFVISAMPKEIENNDIFAKVLAENIGETKELILSKLEGRTSYTVIKRGLAQEDIDKIKSLNLKGIYWERTPARYYPQENLASQVVGFLGGGGTGQYGLEGYYDEDLKGKSGIQEDKRGLDLIFSPEMPGSLDGSDFYLTIDYNIQFEAEILLKEVKKNLNIDSGQIIVMKPDSGRILAMANYPSFDPNQFSKENDLEIFQNSATQKLFEPGSVMKPFIMAMGINEGKVTPDTTFTDLGFIKVGKEIIYNFGREKYGKRTMTEVLEKSINTGAVFVEEKILHNTFLNYMDNYGFFRKTDVDLQGEVYSQNDLLKTGPDVEFATASFGQGIEITPVQLVRGFSVFANGGKLPKPYVVEKTIQGESEMYTKIQPQDQVISQQTASEVTTMMINVVERGYGSEAKILGYYIAGKTGTAEVPLKNGKGYELDKTIQSFIGFAPALNPKFLILIKLDDPKVPKSSLSAAPVFRKLAQYIINYWKIPPDYEVNE
ncbi:MAG: penicillin-binding protein 2 [Patescibacteria group bacterium]